MTSKTKQLNEAEMFDRCLRSLSRSVRRIGAIWQQPSRSGSGYDRKNVFHLRNVCGVLRSYTYDANSNRIREVTP